MSIKKQVETLLNIVSDREIISICSPLQLIDISHFHFCRIYHNGSRFHIATNPNWIEYFYENELHKNAFFHQATTHYLNGIFPWESVRETYNFKQGRDLYGITNTGGTIIINQTNSIDFYHFSMLNSNSSKLIFNLKPQLLYDFILYFHDKAHNLIKDADKYKLLITTNTNPDPIPQKTINEFTRQIKTKRYFLDNEQCYLTKRQCDIIDDYLNGMNYKKMSDKYKIAIKTIDSHIQQTKKNFHGHSATEIKQQIKRIRTCFSSEL